MVIDNTKAVHILEKMIQINTVNGNEEKLAIYLKELLACYGISSHLVPYGPGRSSLVAEVSNGSGKTLALCGHLDVVSAGDETEWTHPPFSAYIDEQGVMWGRGASDMKSGLAALIIAMIELNNSKAFSGTIRLLATVGEEVGEFGSKQLTQAGYLNDVDAVLIAEPCNVGVIYAHKGSLNYTVTSRGVAAHSSMPELGNNAIDHLNDAINEISRAICDEAASRRHPELGETFHNITVIKGGQQVNSIPDLATFEANVRTVPTFDNEAVINLVKKIVADLNKKQGYDLLVEVTADQAPVLGEKDSKLIQTIINCYKDYPELHVSALIQSMGEVMGIDLNHFPGIPTDFQPMAVSGTTDAAQFTKLGRKFDIAVYGPGIPMLNHKIDERIPLKQYIEFISIYQSIISDYLS